MGEDGKTDDTHVACFAVSEVGVGLGNGREFECSDCGFAGAESFYGECFAWLDDVTAFVERGILAVHDIETVYAEYDLEA